MDINTDTTPALHAGSAVKANPLHTEYTVHSTLSTLHYKKNNKEKKRKEKNLIKKPQKTVSNPPPCPKKQKPHNPPPEIRAKQNTDTRTV